MNQQIPCFVVNLATAKARRQSMAVMLARHGIAPTWFDAVDGRIMSDDVLARHVDRARADEEYGPLSRAEIGTTLSHLGIYQKMVEQNLPCAVILEDDVELAEDFPLLLDAHGSQGLASFFKPEEPVMVQMTHVRRAYRWGRTRIGSREIVKPHGGVWLTSGYFITLAAARNLVQNAYPVFMVADHWRYFESKGWLAVYALTPNAVWESEHSQQSDITAAGRVSRRKDPKSLAGRFKRLFDRLFLQPIRVTRLPEKKTD
jgi:glycosyl transferase family 25